MGKKAFPRKLTIKWLREKYRSKELTPEEVIKEIISRAKEDEHMNIWITPPSIEHIRPYLERLYELDFEKTPLWGIPFAIKDNIDQAGVPTTAGCPAYAYIPAEHAEVVERLIAAGAIPLGKTNLDQFATGLVGTRSPYGETCNAFNEELISGGSSSGSAVAVARGHAPFSLGTDTAGSGRVPAALNHLIGLKPSLGAWSTRGVVPACESIDCVTVFSNTLEDAFLIDSLARGFDPNCPWSRNIPHPKKKMPKKICIPKETIEFFGPYASEYRHAWNAAISAINQLGIKMEYIESAVFCEAADMLYEGPWVAERWAAVGEFINKHSNKVFPVTEEVLRSGADDRYSAASVFRTMHRLQDLKCQVRKLLEDAVLVMPTVGGTWTREQVRNNPFETNKALGRFTNHCNLLDLCAIALPSGEEFVKIPFGITFFATYENEGFIFALADLFIKKKCEK